MLSFIKYVFSIFKYDHMIVLFGAIKMIDWASLMAQMVENLPAVWETWVKSLSQEHPYFLTQGTLQYSCLESPMDRGALVSQRAGHD